MANFAGGDDADGNGHGTHVAGIIGGVTYGVAKNVTLLGVKVLSDSGAGSTSGIISGIDFVAEDASTRDCPSGAVINMSIGGSFSTAMNSAAASLVSAGHFVVAAAGNSASDAGNYSPGSEPTACTIGGSDQSDSVMSTSNYGSAIDLYAPGAQIPSAWPDGGEVCLARVRDDPEVWAEADSSSANPQRHFHGCGTRHGPGSISGDAGGR